MVNILDWLEWSMDHPHTLAMSGENMAGIKDLSIIRDFIKQTSAFDACFLKTVHMSITKVGSSFLAALDAVSNEGVFSRGHKLPEELLNSIDKEEFIEDIHELYFQLGLVQAKCMLNWATSLEANSDDKVVRH